MTATAARADVAPHGGMLRYPDVSAQHIVFVYADDLWIVPRDGGVASPLATPPGPERSPRFSPDGLTVAFSANYDGNRDLYTLPVEGGQAFRVTHHPAGESLWDWTADERLILSSSGFTGMGRAPQLLAVGPRGGLPAKLPVPYGADAAISPDGQWLAYTPQSIVNRTWKRYQGGMQSDLWLFNLHDQSAKAITDWPGIDATPMWHGQTLYYLTDSGVEQNHRVNVWAYDVATGQHRQITRFSDYDVKYPAIGPGPTGRGEIVFQHGGDLKLLDLATGEARTVEVTVPGDRPTLASQTLDVSDRVEHWAPSTTGKRAVLEARGDLWTLPLEHGLPINLTASNSAADRDPAWSPDGRWIAYFSDRSGEYQLWITQSDGRGESRQLTSDNSRFLSEPVWSPDSKHLLYNDNSGTLWLCTVETGETKAIDADPWGDSLRATWSHDAAWIAYAKSGSNRLHSVWLYDVVEGTVHQVTSGRFMDSWPTFDRKGDFLFLASNRSFANPLYEDVGMSFVYVDTDMLFAVPLRADVKNPFAPESDEEEWKEEEAAASESAGTQPATQAESQPETAPATEPLSQPQSQAATQPATAPNASASQPNDSENPKEPLRIDLNGFERRMIALPVGVGAFTNLCVSHDGKLIYTRGGARSSGESSIRLFDFDEIEKGERTVLAVGGEFRMTPGGKKLLVRSGRRLALIDPAPDQKSEKGVEIVDLFVSVDPRVEWKAIFTDVWRIFREYFYDPGMHGVDWDAARRRYEAMLADCVSRDDVNYVIGELVSELNVSHAYVSPPQGTERLPSVAVGMLGCDFELATDESGRAAYRIASLVEGGAWDHDGRGPLSQPGVDCKAGDFLLAVNGVPVDVSKDPWASLQGLAGQVVTLTLSEKPVFDETARQVLVKPIADESSLRYRAWIENNRRYVEEKSGGRIGYIHVPNTGQSGQNELFRQFYGQIDRPALIIDERWNGGGQTSDRFVELLNRPILNYRVRRYGNNIPWPPDAHQGPKCMLINGSAGSGGDLFPYYFRARTVGKLIGTRTWGGIVGLTGNPDPIDGSSISVPTRAFYELDGTWGIEGHGVEPDIEVLDDPSKMLNGADPQLDAAVAHLLSELENNPFVPTPRPPYRDRSRSGILDEDR